MAVESVVGLPFKSLYEAVKEVSNDKNKFRTALKNLELTLDSLEPLIKEKVHHGISDEFPDESLGAFRNTIENGVELVRKCSNLRAWRAYKMYRYNHKLIELETSLRSLVDKLRIQAMRDVGKTWNLVDNRETSIIKEMTRLNAKPQLPYFTVGIDEPLHEVNKKLLTDDMSLLVLTGPGGCGKTTLAAIICQDAIIQENFRHNIFFLTFGKTPSMSLILQQLKQQVGYVASNFDDEENADRWLQEILKGRGQNFLFILDDVWPGSESLVKKFIPNEKKYTTNYKILVTSRYEFPELGPSYQLSLLTDEHSMALFHHSVFLGDRDKSPYVPLDLSREIVKNCKGLPLAILVVGKSLCGKPIQIWRNTLLKLSKGYSILDSDSGLLFRLQSSLDDLGKESHIAKESFIDLASFPEDQAIPVPALIDIWVELYDDLNEDLMCFANLYELKSRSLVNVLVRREVEDDYSEHFVTQHDLLRSLAIHHARHDPVLSKRLNLDIRGDDLPKWWTEQAEKPKRTRLLSISTDEVFTTWPVMQLPMAEVLVLNSRTRSYTLPKFIKHMRKSLKVLIVTNYGCRMAELNQFHLLSSLSNLKTIRLQGLSIPSLAIKPTIYLENLKKISFSMCNISQAFRKEAIPICHAFPLLVEINIDYCNDLVELQDGICNLLRLKKLRITNCHKLSAIPKEIGKLLNLEVWSLRSCTDLVKLPASVRNLKKLEFLDISNCFSIRELPEDIGELCSLKKLNMRECLRLQELPLSILNLEKLEEVICDEDTQGLWEPFLPIARITEIRVVKEPINLDWLQKLQL